MLTNMINITGRHVAVIGARLDRLPPTRYIWYLVGLVSFGAFFEIYDLSLTAPLSLGLLVAGVFHRGAAGLLCSRSLGPPTA